MKIEYDAHKRAETLATRGLDFLDAWVVIEDAVTTFENTRFAYPEARMVSFGPRGGRLLSVVWVQLPEGIRVVSMRKANDRERARYQRRMD